MKFIGKYITYVGLFYLFSMMVYGWYYVSDYTMCHMEINKITIVRE